VAEGKDKKEFKVDTTMLTGLWDKMKKKVEETRAPALVHKDLDVTGGLIRDLLSPDVGKVMIDRRREFQEVNKYLKALDPKLRSIVELYDDAEPIFDKMGIENEIEKMFNRRVWLRGGAYLVIDQTEALVTIDINTGRFSGKVRGEDAIYRTNLSAAREIARQIRLRDIGGIIIIDFIDMEDRERRRRVYEELKRSLARDRSENYISSISDLGLVEMTRKRVGPSYMHSISDPCPVCDGVGRVLSRESMAVKIERWFKRARSASPLKHYHLITNSQVGELLLEGKPSRLHILQKNINLKVDLIIDTSYDPDEFSVFDASSEIDVTDRYTSREQP
jgi:ribonuclease G